jgi:hypothetical protein
MGRAAAGLGLLLVRPATLWAAPRSLEPRADPTPFPPLPSYIERVHAITVPLADRCRVYRTTGK